MALPKETINTETPSALIALQDMGQRVNHWLLIEDIAPDREEPGLGRQLIGVMKDSTIFGAMVGAGERFYSSFLFSHLQNVLVGRLMNPAGLLMGEKINVRELVWAAGSSFNSLALDVVAGFHGVLSAGAFFLANRGLRVAADRIAVRDQEGVLTSLGERVDWLTGHTRLGRFAKFLGTPARVGVSAAIGAGLGDGQLLNTMLIGTRWFPSNEMPWQMLTRLGVDPSQIAPAVASDMKDAALASFATVLALKTIWAAGKTAVRWGAGVALEKMTS